MSTALKHLIDVDANFLHDDLQAHYHTHLRDALSAGVSQFIVPGSTLASSKAVIALAEQHPNVIFPTCGIHPFHVSAEMDLMTTMDEIRHLAAAKLVRCIGECGLDITPGFPALDLQLRWFRAHVELACELQKPLFLHERLCFDQLMPILQTHKSQLPPVLIHCFTGTADQLSKYIDFGCYISFSGFMLNPKKHQLDPASLRALLNLVPQDRIMIETDAPYLGFPGCRKGFKSPKATYPNLPAALPLVASGIAEILNVSSHEFAENTIANAKRFFSL